MHMLSFLGANENSQQCMLGGKWWPHRMWQSISRNFTSCTGILQAEHVLPAGPCFWTARFRLPDAEFEWAFPLHNCGCDSTALQRAPGSLHPEPCYVLCVGCCSCSLAHAQASNIPSRILLLAATRPLVHQCCRCRQRKQTGWGKQSCYRLCLVTCCN